MSYATLGGTLGNLNLSWLASVASLSVIPRASGSVAGVVSRIEINNRASLPTPGRIDQLLLGNALTTGTLQDVFVSHISEMATLTVQCGASCTFRNFLFAAANGSAPLKITGAFTVK